MRPRLGPPVPRTNATLSDELDLAILRLLAAGESRSESIATALGRPARTVKYRLRRLRDVGLAESPSRGTWRLTGAGGRAALAATVSEPAGWLDALQALPAEHRAVLRLVEDAIVARRAVEAVYPTNWPGFLLLGPTKTGKTLLGSLAARRFGLDPTEAIRLLMRETPGSLLGRRVQDGAEAWRTVPSPLLGFPLVVLDEYDKAPPEVRQAAFAYLAGASRYSLEGESLEVHATTIIALNDDDGLGRLLPDAYLRRLVMLDTSALVDATGDLHKAARVLTRAVIPVLAPTLAPPAPELPAGAWNKLGELLRACLTVRGWQLVDVEAISRLVLGCWALAPADAEAAALSVAADYLLVSATRPGLVEPDWPARFEAQAGRADAPIAAILVTARARQAAGEIREAANARVDLVGSLELAGRRDSLIGALDHARESAPRSPDRSDAERRTIDAARGKARPLREAIAAARSLDALDELEVLLEREILVPLRVVGDAVEGRRQAAVQARHHAADARQREVMRKKAEHAAKQAAQRAAKSRHAELQALYRRVRTSPEEDVVGELLAARCLTQRSQRYEEETLDSRIAGSIVGRAIRSLRGSASPPPEPEPPPSRWGLGPALRHPSPPVPSGPEPRYVTRTRIWYEDRAGRHLDARDLLAWGNAPVRAVLEVTAVAEQLPRLTLAARRRRQPTRRASPPASSRRP